MKQVKAKDLKVGMVCDLEVDLYAVGQHPHPHPATIGNQFVRVEHVEKESADCIDVDFNNFDQVSFPTEHRINVKTGFIN